MLTLIIGKESNLSKHLYQSLENSIVISSRELSENINLLDEYRNNKFNIIFNNFQTANLLGDLTYCYNYIEQSIGITAKVLQYIKNWKINKVLYASSSSVYGDNHYCNENDKISPINLHGSLKASNEYLISRYCIDNSIDFTIMRIFNMYGGDDSFSIISKIIKSYKNNKELSIINNGKGIRDFIHIDDVVHIITLLLTKKNINIINLGTGMEHSIYNIISILKLHGFEIKVNNSYRENEIKISIADSKRLSLIFDQEFIKVEDYILKELGN